MRYKLTFAALLSMTGCASVGEVMPVGKDTYMLGVQVRGGENWTKVKGHVITRANAFCAEKGKAMELDDTKTSGARGWTPQGAEIKFRCVDK